MATYNPITGTAQLRTIDSFIGIFSARCTKSPRWPAFLPRPASVLASARVCFTFGLARLTVRLPVGRPAGFSSNTRCYACNGSSDAAASLPHLFLRLLGLRRHASAARIISGSSRSPAFGTSRIAANSSRVTLFCPSAPGNQYPQRPARSIRHDRFRNSCHRFSASILLP